MHFTRSLTLATSEGASYLVLSNPESYAVDVSGWKIESAAAFRFAPGVHHGMPYAYA